MIYRSNLTCPDLTPHFKHVFCTVGPFGHDVPHDWADKADDDPYFGIFKRCGLWTHDEAAILWNIAERRRGDWIDIGSHTGWTTAHILGDTSHPSHYCYAVDPLYGSEEALKRACEQIAAAGPGHSCQFMALNQTSKKFFPECHHHIDGVCIDGDHSRPIPLQDAQGAHKHLAENGVIVFHDFIGTPVQEAVAWLIQQGYKYRIYTTPQMVACCWRGNFEPPEHDPDTAIASVQPFDWNTTEWWR